MKERDMLIAGFQKTSLIDFPGKVACTIFTSGCNLRCCYCHNASLVLDNKKEAVISNQAFFDFLKKRKGILDGVCISGGEPLLQKDLASFVGKIKELGYLVKLDSNGCFPKALKQLVNKGLIDYVAMDIKNSPDHYHRVIGDVNLDLDKINESLEFLIRGDLPFELRTTAIKGIHTAADFSDIAKWIKGAKAYYIQNYSNSFDTIGLRQNGESHYESFTKADLEGFLKIVQKELPAAKIRSVNKVPKISL